MTQIARDQAFMSNLDYLYNEVENEANDVDKMLQPDPTLKLQEDFSLLSETTKESLSEKQVFCGCSQTSPTKPQPIACIASEMRTKVVILTMLCAATLFS